MAAVRRHAAHPRHLRGRFRLPSGLARRHRRPLRLLVSPGPGQRRRAPARLRPCTTWRRGHTGRWPAARASGGRATGPPCTSLPWPSAWTPRSPSSGPSCETFPDHPPQRRSLCRQYRRGLGDPGRGVRDMATGRRPGRPRRQGPARHDGSRPPAGGQRPGPGRLDPGGSSPLRLLGLRRGVGAAGAVRRPAGRPADAAAGLYAAVEAGGDTDTVASMAGQVVGAWVGFGGLPPELVRRRCRTPRSAHTGEFASVVAALESRSA